MKKIKLIIIFCTCFNVISFSQELQAKVTVLSQQVATTVDKKIFTTLQTQLSNLLNNRKWTNEVFQQSEKIECQFLLNIESIIEPNVYKAKLTVQAARPAYNSDYKSALVNYLDADVVFKYIEYQPVEFNENRVQGTDALSANLTATIAYYAYIILGLDYNSFSPKGGIPYFQKALNIVNNAPEAKSITGWRAFDGVRNKYWLAENLLNKRFNVLHDAIYEYYRKAMDNAYTDEVNARKNLLAAITKLQSVNAENPNSMIVQFFMQGRSTEIIGMMKKSSPTEKKQAVDILSLLDVANISKYKQELR